MNPIHTSLFCSFVPLILQNKLKTHPFSFSFSELEKAGISDNRWSVPFKIGVCIVCANNMNIFASVVWFDFLHRMSNKKYVVGYKSYQAGNTV